MSGDGKQEKLAQLTGITSDTITATLKGFHGSRVKEILSGIFKLSLEEVRTKIEVCNPSELANLQGLAKGLRIAIGNLDFGMPKEDR